MGQTFGSGWRAAVRAIIPAHSANDENSLRQATRIVAFTLAMLVWVPVYMVIFSILRAPLSFTIVASAGINLLLMLIMLHRGASVRFCANVMCGICFVTYTLLGLVNGGPVAPAVIWYASIPLLSLWIAGTGSGVFWTSLSLLAITGFFAARELGHEFNNELTPSGLRFLLWTGILGIVSCVFLLVEVLKRVESAVRESLALALENAKAADRAKSEFLANMSHEIRTPMTAILGYVDLLSDAAEDHSQAPSRQEAVQSIRRNGAHLLQIIGDILDLSKIEVGKFMLEQANCSPVETISDVVRMMRVRAKHKRLTLTLKFRGPVPTTITTDPLRLRQILINLIGNAIKFTEIGGVRVEVSLVRQQGEPRLQCVIADSGMGIPERQLATLFQPFTQGDTSTARRYGGAGLGLAISKRLAIMLGGDLTVDSQVGTGSTFSFSIDPGPIDPARLVQIDDDPARSGFRPAPPLPPDEVQLDCRVLLAEDGPDNRRLISYVLERAGAKVMSVNEGESAVREALAARAAGMPYDVVLLDIQMPLVDGYQAAERLRAAEYQGPIIALTAHAMRGDRGRCLEAGCDDYATKPIDRHALVRLVAKYAGKTAAHCRATGEKHTPQSG
jgi:signal transduction histidine kinase/ActR/RegA family two-component response regulator